MHIPKLPGGDQTLARTFPDPETPENTQSTREDTLTAVTSTCGALEAERQERDAPEAASSKCDKMLTAVTSVLKEAQLGIRLAEEAQKAKGREQDGEKADEKGEGHWSPKRKG